MSLQFYDLFTLKKILLLWLLSPIICQATKNTPKISRPRNINSKWIESESPYEQLETLKRMPKTLHVNPVYWQGLNTTHIHLKYPGIMLLDTYKGPSVTMDLVRTTTNITLYQLEDIFYNSLKSFHVLCTDMKRFGNFGDGGWEVCLSPPFHLSDHCLVYSFGIDFDLSFDDDIANREECNVRSFDPSMLVGDQVRTERVFFYQVGLGPLNSVNPQKWKLKDLQTIKHLLNHHNMVIDLLKMDIEFDEWKCLEAMIADQSLSNVKQLIFEAHSPLKFNTDINATEMAEHYRRMLSILEKLEKSSFRRYFYHPNPVGKVVSAIDGGLVECCFELYYINLKFLLN